MKEYSDLELNKMIAKLEGYKVVAREGYECCAMNEDDVITHMPYSPLSGATKTLLFHLMVKYKVSVFYPVNVISIASEFSGKPPAARVDYKSESEIPRAIIMCILKSENII